MQCVLAEATGDNVTAQPKIRVFSVDDHPLLREGIAAIINNELGMEMAAQAETGRDAIRQYREHLPDVTLMDLRLPDISGIDAMIAIRNEFRDARIVMLTTFEGDVEMQRALIAGARGLCPQEHAAAGARHCRPACARGEEAHPTGRSGPARRACYRRIADAAGKRRARSRRGRQPQSGHQRRVQCVDQGSRRQPDEKAATASVDVRYVEVEDRSLGVDRERFPRPKRRSASNEIPGVPLGHFRSAHRYGLCTNRARERLQRHFAIAVHEDNERLLSLGLQDEGLHEPHAQRRPVPARSAWRAVRQLLKPRPSPDAAEASRVVAGGQVMDAP